MISVAASGSRSLPQKSTHPAPRGLVVLSVEVPSASKGCVVVEEWEKGQRAGDLALLSRLLGVVMGCGRRVLTRLLLWRPREVSRGWHGGAQISDQKQQTTEMIKKCECVFNF